MAKVVASVRTTGERLVADLQAHVVAVRVSSAFFDRAANVLALVAPAGLHLVAKLGAGEGLC